jgi:hypothetical protein
MLIPVALSTLRCIECPTENPSAHNVVNRPKTFIETSSRLQQHMGIIETIKNLIRGLTLSHCSLWLLLFSKQSGKVS